MLRGMPTVAEIKSLEGADVALQLVEVAGGDALEGRVVGTLDAADGLVVFIEPAAEPGGRRSYNYQHIAAIQRR
jgi:hypothetical protein